MALVLQFLSTKIFQRTLSFSAKELASSIPGGCSRFASAKVRLFCKQPKKHERNFKKITKNGGKRDNKGKNTPYLYYYRDSPPAPLQERGADTSGRDTGRLINPYREQRSEYSIRSARQYYMQRCDDSENKERGKQQ